MPGPEPADTLRTQKYNATLVDIKKVHETLAIFRVRPDFSLPPYQPGQYTSLGLGYWEPRHPMAVEEGQFPEKKRKRVARRAYSISCPVLGADGELFPAEEMDFLEFYIVLVKGQPDQVAPALTARLFLLEPGDRLYTGEKIIGEYTLGAMESIRGREDTLVVFAATGTGEGPHNAMIWELLRTGFQGKIASIVCVRHKKDLAYEAVHRRLEERHPNFSYHTLTTQETGASEDKMYIQDYISSGRFEERLGREMRPADTHIFLCGNPSMIGVPKIRNGEKIWPEGKKRVIQIMEERGFAMDFGRTKKNIHYEKYW